MLAPRASSAFVCLRCELKLARPRTSAAARPSSYANFSTTARRHDAVDESQTPTPGNAPARENAASKPLRISKEYMRKGTLVRQRKAKLGMKRMDEEADILVLNEASTPEQAAKQEPEPLEPISVPDILSSLQQDSAPATQEDVKKQLETLRPVRASPDEPHYVTTADFVKLIAALSRGFTTTQLSHYYSSAKSIKQDTLYKMVKATVKATKRSDWHPTTTNIEKRLPGVETMAKSPAKQKAKNIRKATLVDKILRDVWQLEILEELEAPGELELKLKDWELKLLQAGGNDSNLARIAKIRNAKVEIHWPTNVLRITADKNTAEYTANDIEEALSKARTTSLDLKRWAEQLKVPLDADLVASLPVDYVSSLTGTNIVASADHTLKIRGLDEASGAEAKRTLIRLLPFKESAMRTIDTQRLDAAKHDSYLLPAFHETKSLDYIYRSLSLGRWALPVARLAEANASEEQKPARESVESNSDLERNIHSLVNRVISTVRPPVDGTFTGPESKPRNRQTGYWALEPEYKVSADFGQALFPLENSDPNRVIEAASDSSQSPFQPAIPGLGSLLASSEFQNLSRTETPALVYDFIPSPDQKDFDGVIGPDFPKLHVQVRTGREGNRPTIHKLSLGFQERIHDVLLPDQATDIRFYRYGRLRFSSKSHHDKNVENWSEAVRQNIESGGRLSAPSLILDIPKWTIPGFPSDAIGMVSIKYLFSGIQFRQSVTGRLLDTQVSYSTMQSGKLGAKGGVLSAYSEKLTTQECEAQIRAFASKCVQMVHHITRAGAQTQPPSLLALPRNETGSRRLRRAAMKEEHVQLMSEEAAQSQDADLASEAKGDSDAALASRLDDAVVMAAEAETAVDQARSEAEADAAAEAEASKNQDQATTQEQEADALLDDLFGPEPVPEPEPEPVGEDSSKAEETEHDILPKKSEGA